MRRSVISSLATALGVAGVVALTAACADEPTRPRDAAPPTTETRPSLGLGTEERGQLGAALLFASRQSILALHQRAAAEELAAAFGAAAERLEADDAAGTERSLAAARQAVKRYRELAGESEGSSGAAVDLAAMDLTLERATELAAQGRVARADAGNVGARASTISRQERQP